MGPGASAEMVRFFLAQKPQALSEDTASGNVGRELFGSQLAPLLILILAGGLVVFSDGRATARARRSSPY